MLKRLLIVLLFLTACTPQASIDYSSMSDNELFSYLAESFDDKDLFDAMLATRQSCDVFTRINETLSNLRSIEGNLYLNGGKLSHEDLIDLITIYYRQAGFEVPPVRGVLVMSGEESFEWTKSGEGLISDNSFLLIDTFVKHENGFFADNGRTWIMGDINEEQEKQFSAVKDSLTFSQKLYLPGNEASVVATGIYDFFENLGFETDDKQGLLHMPGHGVSRDGHGGPFVSLESKDIFSVGDIVTTENALYYRLDGGVRLENTGVISDSGFIPFCDFPLENRIFLNK